MMRTEHLMGNATSVKISKRVEENSSTVSLYFELPDSYSAISPGEFLMIWVPSVDEIPMSICSWSPPTIGVTVKSVGDATEALSEKKEGDWIGVRGPFGRPFYLDSYNALVVGGGVGVPPLRFLVDTLLSIEVNTTLVVAAKTKDELILYDFLKRKNPNLTVEIATDDGSMGFKGFATELAENLLKNQEFDTIYTCGPELMMAGLHRLSTEYRVKFQASLERYMKCGCAICGTCAMDPTGDLVCKDGPVFTGKELDRISEFGEYHRDATGVKKKF
ncbi:MAG: dihydroorotate dehydrogenase electron transfer subunit [Candidatus Thorarchaeota archaeon]